MIQKVSALRGWPQNNGGKVFGECALRLSDGIGLRNSLSAKNDAQYQNSNR
jgi:hypothetical protein